MGDTLTFPPVRVPAVLPHPEDLLVALVKDEGVATFPIPTPLTTDTIPNTTEARAALNAVNRLRQTFTSPFGTPDAILDRPTWLRMILETLAGTHEGFRNAQLISPDEDLPKSFQDLNSEERNAVARIFEVTSWLQDFCEAAEDDHDENHIAPFWTLCIHCIESADLPPPPPNVTDIMLSNALEARAFRETLRNQAVQQAIKDIDNWRAQQTETLISDLVASLTSQTPDLSTLAHEVGLDPRVQKWVNNIRPCLRLAAIQMINQETVEDCLVPHTQEILEAEWLWKQTEIQTQLQAKSDQYQEQLTADMEVMIEAKKQTLQHAADEYLRNFERELDATTADDVQHIKNKSKSIIQQARDEEESWALQSVIRTPKASKPSPLNISKPKKKKKKHTILDLTTPSPGNEPSDNHTDMETDTDSTPTTPVCRSSAPSPVPHDAPDIVPTTVVDPDSIPRWARTPSPDDKTPHAPSFTITAPPTAPPPTTNPPPVTNPPNTKLSAVFAVLAGLCSELINRIDEVNARVDLASGPQTIADHVAWNEANLSA